jgi:hypothetical protein
MPRFAKLSAPALLLATLAGCGDVASPEYPGEVLAVVRGVLVSEVAKPLPEVDLVIAWPDWSKGDGTSTSANTFVRLPVDATLPARFSASIFDAPPETAYSVQPPGYPRLVGPRFTSATFYLVRKGREVTSNAAPALDFALADQEQPVLALFDEYMLTYFEDDGKMSLLWEDGTLTDLSWEETKGFHLMRQDRVWCTVPDSADEDCIADEVDFWGATREDAWWTCATKRQEVKAVEVPLDTEITLTLQDGSVTELRPPLCTTPSPV